MNLKKLFSLINKNNKCIFGEGVSEHAIKEAEKKLGVKFPESYKIFLMKFGWLEIGTNVIKGLGNDLNVHKNIVDFNIEKKKILNSNKFHDYLVIIYIDHRNGYHCLDTNEWENDECPVVECLANTLEILYDADNFTEWLEIILEDLEII